MIEKVLLMRAHVGEDLAKFLRLPALTPDVPLPSLEEFRAFYQQDIRPIAVRWHNAAYQVFSALPRERQHVLAQELETSMILYQGAQSFQRIQPQPFSAHMVILSQDQSSGSRFMDALCPVVDMTADLRLQQAFQDALGWNMERGRLVYIELLRRLVCSINDVKEFLPVELQYARVFRAIVPATHAPPNSLQ